MNKYLSAATISAFAACGSYNQAFAEDDAPTLYGIGFMQCSTINNIFKGASGQLAMMSYIGGFVSAVNIATAPKSDALNGLSLDDAATSVFKYCKTHRGEQGLTAIGDVLTSAMKE